MKYIGVKSENNRFSFFHFQYCPNFFGLDRMKLRSTKHRTKEKVLQMNNSGLHSGVVVSTVASQQEGSCFESQLGPFCVEYAWFLSECSSFLPPKNMYVRLIGDFKLALEVSVVVCLYMALWPPVQGVPCLSRNDS